MYCWLHRYPWYIRIYSTDMISENFEGGPSIRDFVFQDAIERAFEINIKGIKEYEIEKRHIYQ
jgi:hypothetical protein